MWISFLLNTGYNLKSGKVNQMVWIQYFTYLRFACTMAVSCGGDGGEQPFFANVRSKIKVKRKHLHGY